MSKKGIKSNEATNIIIGLSNIENIDRHGEAADIFARGYNGGDVSRTLKSISEYSDDSAQGSKQGYSAEALIRDRKNAHNAVKGNPERYATTDDIGCSNDPVADMVLFDESGALVPDSQSQIKFIKSDTLVDGYINNRKVGAGRWDRYDNVSMEVPSDRIDEIKEKIETKIEKYNKQIQHAKKTKNTELEKKLQNKIDRAKRLNKNLKDSGVSTADTEYAVNHPLRYTAKEIVKTVHDGGLTGAKFGAVIGGSVALLSGVVAYANGSKNFETILCETAKSTGKSAAKGYLTAASGALVKAGMMHSTRMAITKEVQKEFGKTSKKKIAQEVAKRLAKNKAIALSKTTLPTLIVTTTLELSGSIAKYVRGEIDGVQFFEELGQKGTNMLASSASAALGQLVIPIPVVGAVVGGMIGYSLSASFYAESLKAFKEAKEAKENYLLLKKECEQASKILKNYRHDLEKTFDAKFGKFKNQIQNSLDATDAAIQQGDMDNFCLHANNLGTLIGSTLQFASFEEFDEFMQTDDTLTL